MRLEFPSELAAFRAEVRAFIAEHTPGVKTHTGVRAPDPALVPAIREFTAALFEAGYLSRYGQRLRSIEFGVLDVDRTAAYLRSRGLRVVEGSRPGAIAVAEEDNWGVRWEFAESAD